MKKNQIIKLPSSINNSIPSGLSSFAKITSVLINSDEWTKLPIDQSINRHAINIQNNSNTEIRLQYDPSANYENGIVMPKNTERYYQITNDIIIYARSSSGNVTLTVEELG